MSVVKGAIFVGRWVLVAVAVIAAVTFVPLIELVRAVFARSARRPEEFDAEAITVVRLAVRQLPVEPRLRRPA